MPEELWTEVHDIVQQEVIKTIPKKKKCKRQAKWLSEEALQIAEKRREAKSKEEKKGYTHFNAEFQRIVQRDKETLLSDQCKEIEENDRMGKTRDLSQGNISFKDGHKKRLKWYGPKRSRRYKKKWQEHTEELYRKRSSQPR